MMGMLLAILLTMAIMVIVCIAVTSLWSNGG